MSVLPGALAALGPGGGGPQAEQVAALFLLTYKPTTASAYAVDLKQWFAWCALFDVDPFDAVRAHVDAWTVHLADDGRARPATLARKISAVRNFYAYAVDSGYAASSPVPTKDKALHLPRVSRKSQTLGPDREESAAMLAAAAERGVRDEAVVSVLLYQGLRVSELCGIDVEDLSTQRGHRVVRLRRKGGEEQDQAIAPPAAGCLDAWLAERAASLRFRRRAVLRAGVRRARGRAPDPVSGRVDRRVLRAGRRDREEDQPALAAPRLHHDAAGRRRAAARHPGLHGARQLGHHRAVRPRASTS